MKEVFKRFATAVVAACFIGIFTVGAGIMPGCATIGVQAPKTFNEGLLAAYQTHTAILRAATAALESHEIASTDVEALIKVADQARSLLDAARAAHAGGDVTTAEGRLALATSLLLQVQGYLRKP